MTLVCTFIFQAIYQFGSNDKLGGCFKKIYFFFTRLRQITLCIKVKFSIRQLPSLACDPIWKQNKPAV